MIQRSCVLMDVVFNHVLAIRLHVMANVSLLILIIHIVVLEASVTRMLQMTKTTKEWLVPMGMYAPMGNVA